MMVTRTARQLLALRKRKRKDSLFNPNLEELKNISTILQENKGKAARKKLYQQSGIQSAMDVIRKKRGAK